MDELTKNKKAIYDIYVKPQSDDLLWVKNIISSLFTENKLRYIEVISIFFSFDIDDWNDNFNINRK